MPHAATMARPTTRRSQSILRDPHAIDRDVAIGSHVQNTGFSGLSIETMHWQGKWPGRAVVRRQGSLVVFVIVNHKEPG